MASQLIWTVNCAAIVRNITTVFRKRWMLRRTCWIGVRCVCARRWCSSPLGHSVSVSFHMGSLPVAFHLITQGPRCIRGVHHTWAYFLPLTTTCSASIGTHAEGVISSNAYVRTQVTWDALAGAAVTLILSDLSSSWRKHLSGSKKPYFRSPLILGEYAGKWAAGGENAARVGLYSRRGLISPHLPWEMGLINRRQYIYLQIKTDTHHWTQSGCYFGYNLSGRLSLVTKLHNPQTEKVTVQPLWSRNDVKGFKYWKDWMF